MRHRILETCTGRFVVRLDDAGVVRTTWVDAAGDDGLPADSRADGRLLPDLVARLEAYFDGAAVDFDDVPLPPGPPFAHRCWDACRRIPRGRTCTYGALAATAGSPAAARAAGQAMRHNPMPVLVPCHRVLPRHGGLGGFAGSTDVAGASLARKRKLLELEGIGAGCIEASRHEASSVETAELFTRCLDGLMP